MHWWRREREEARTPLHRFNNDMVFIDGRFLPSAGSAEELDEHTHYIDYDEQAVYIGVDPAGRTVEITAHDTALLRTSAQVHGKVSDKKGPVILGITFTQYAWTALAIEGKRHFTHLDEPVDEPVGPADPATYGKEVIGTRLENVTISFCGRVAGYFRGDGLVIRNSLISDTGTEGIYIIGSSDVLLERNIVLRNDIERITGYYVSAVKIINQTHNVVVRDNLVMDHPTSHGVWYDVGNRDGVFINNYVEGVDAGFFFEISRGVTVAGNVFVNNKMGSWILNSADAHLYNNTYIDSPARFTRTERSAQGDHFDWHPATGPGVKERYGHIFMNNLMVASKADAAPLLQVDQPLDLCKELKQPALSAMDGNVYVRPGTPYAALAAPLINWVDTGSANCAITFASLAAFRERVPGFEAHGRQLEGDARSVFVAPDISRYQPRRALPASRDVAMPQTVRKLLDWSKKDAALTTGAYPVKRR
jgi:parallel beta-helix repeat protein